MSIVCLLIGIGCLSAALLTHTELDSLLSGLSGAGLGMGCTIIAQALYWSSSGHEKAYHEKLENKQIELHDELKEKLRDKSGRYAYVLGMTLTGISIAIIAVLNPLQLIESGSVLIFQYAAGIVIFRLRS